ncbi:ankyrin, partial [Macroventuria anomochaeta]
SLLKEFLAKGASATTTDHNLDTPLHHAAHCSFTEVLLEHGADINATNRQGHSPLYTACKHNRLDVAKLLLSRGADVNAIVRDEHWLSLMFLVIETYWHDCGGALSPRLQLADLLLGHGADVHAATKDGTTVLHKAVQFIDAALVRHLVERGADVHATTAAGQS